MFDSSLWHIFDFEEAKRLHRTGGAPIVVKADGLGLGKGVVVAETVEQAVEAAHEMPDNKSQTRCVWSSRNFLTGKNSHSFAFVNGDKFLHYANSPGPQTCLRW